MSYSTVIAGLKERFATVPGLPQYNEAGELANILDYEPAALHTTPTVYMLFDSFVRPREGGQVVAPTYRILCRLCLKWQDNEFAEQELIPFVNSLPASIDQDPQLGNRVTRGTANATDAQGTFVLLGGTLYRALDMYVEVPDKGNYGEDI